MKKEFFIKNMVCDRCIKVLKTELQAAGLTVEDITLGRVVISTEKDETVSQKVADIAHNNGFELLTDPQDHLVERVKIEFINLLNHLPLNRQRKLSGFLAETLGISYSKISRTFSEKEGLTVEKYFIKLKIERAKELIQSNQYNFTEIGHLLDYSTVNHLSNQFKTETGMTLSAYKEQKHKARKPLDGIM